MNAKSFPSDSSTTVDPVSAEWLIAATLAPEGSEAEALSNNINKKPQRFHQHAYPHEQWQWHQLGHMQICTFPQADNHASTPPLSFFTGRIALPVTQPTT